jgi:hypothetical protein
MVLGSFRVLHGLDGVRFRHRRPSPAALLFGPGRRLQPTEGAAAAFSTDERPRLLKRRFVAKAVIAQRAAIRADTAPGAELSKASRRWRASRAGTTRQHPPLIVPSKFAVYRANSRHFASFRVSVGSRLLLRYQSLKWCCWGEADTLSDPLCGRLLAITGSLTSRKKENSCG